MVLEKVRTIIDNYSLLFHFDNDTKEIKEFIKTNFIVGKSETSKIKIDKTKAKQETVFCYALDG